MQIKAKVLIIFGFLLSLAIQAEEVIEHKECNLKQLKLILGSWQAESKKSITNEQWKQVSEHTYEGTGTVIDKKTKGLKASEALRLVRMGDNIFYIAKPRQNSLPVAFKLISCVDGNYLFENPQHDFPKEIIYSFNNIASQRESIQQMQVKVSDGADQGFSLDFKAIDK